jgi:choline dehydrogenase-like flavoprotein
MKEQDRFDRAIGAALSRRDFLTGLMRASAAAVALQATGCGVARVSPVKKAPGTRHLLVFTESDAAVIRKVIDGFVPPDLPIRKLLRDRDPDYDFVATFDGFVYPHGEAFADNMRTLVRFLESLPTFTPLFFSESGLPTFTLTGRTDADATRFFLHLRDSGFRALRSLFQGAKVIGTQPIYVNEPVVWRQMDYPGPWLLSSADVDADFRRPTSYDLAEDIEEGLATLRASVVPHDQLRSRMTAATVERDDADKVVLETDIAIIGSGAGGGVVAAELASSTSQRVLVLEKGDFVEPREFTQREAEMIPRLYDVEFSAVDVPVLDAQVPTMSSTIVRGKLVGGSATINHALAFETPKPILHLWKSEYGATFDYSDLKPHFDAIRSELHIQPVPDEQICGNNLLLKKGSEALDLPAHGIATRNAHQCIGCGFCDVGCRYNRKLTPLNVLLPRAARHGAQVIANCNVDRIDFEDVPRREQRGARGKRARAVIGRLTDGRGTAEREIEIRARRVVLSAGPMDSPRVLLRSRLDAERASKGYDRAIGQRLSTHAPVTYYGLFEEALYPSAGGPPMSYCTKVYENRTDPDPERDLIAYALEGIFNHPMAHAQLMPFESPRGHWEYMRRFNQTMTVAILLRDRAVGVVSEKSFDYVLAPEDRATYVEAIRLGARIMFAAGARQVFFAGVQPLILESVDEVDEKLTTGLFEDGHIMITSGHPMGGCCLGGDPKRDVVDSNGKSWDVEGLYVADASIFPTSLGTNPCYTVYTLARFIAHRMIDEMSHQMA